MFWGLNWLRWMGGIGDGVCRTEDEDIREDLGSGPRAERALKQSFRAEGEA